MRTEPLFRLLLPALLLVVVGCRQDMHDGPKIEPLEASRVLPRGQGSQPLPAGTIARGDLRADATLYSGRGADGELVGELPVEIDRALLVRGQSRFEVFCSPCHGRTGAGNGMVVQRGFKAPESFHSEKLRTTPIGHYFDVMTQGFGVMSSYAAQVPVKDRWAIAAYIRVLQLSQHASVDDPELRAELERHLAEPTAAPVEESH